MPAQVQEIQRKDVFNNSKIPYHEKTQNSTKLLVKSIQKFAKQWMGI